jgi:hypothetical protein
MVFPPFFVRPVIRQEGAHHPVDYHLQCALLTCKRKGVESPAEVMAWLGLSGYRILGIRPFGDQKASFREEDFTGLELGSLTLAFPTIYSARG